MAPGSRTRILASAARARSPISGVYLAMKAASCSSDALFFITRESEREPALSSMMVISAAVAWTWQLSLTGSVVKSLLARRSYAFRDHGFKQFTAFREDDGQFTFPVKYLNRPRRIQEPGGPKPVFWQRSSRVAIASLEALAEGFGITPGVAEQAPYIPER